MSEYSLLRELYETEKKLPNRNFAHGHNFEEWVANRNRIVQVDHDRVLGCDGEQESPETEVSPVPC